MTTSLFSRRAALAAAGAAGATALLPDRALSATFTTPDPVTTIVDSHIHLFDPNRPQGVPYAGPEKSPTHRTGSFPAAYAQHAKPLGIIGAIVVEASPLVEDNQWVLDQAAGNPIILGMIGNLRPEHADFPELLARFHANTLFRGIRYGNLWDYDLAARSREPAFLDGLRRLADADLVLETANQNIALLEGALRVSDAVPHLRIVIDHLPAFDPTPADQRAYQAALRNFAARPQIACKLSEIIHPMAGAIHTDLAAYSERLGMLRRTFGEDRVIFGSDYPQSDSVAALPQVVGLAKAAFAGSSTEAREKFFIGNSRKFYKWLPRSKAKAG
ncbi:amidohydrolase family protein [Novosphingobium sp.]|uniref:amidohydrolase family protein n=1 Tax=Novosphingobium sp. TaxID=1874826 RepID=UPI0031D4EC33